MILPITAAGVVAAGTELYSRRMRLLGLDVGDKVVGVALSDETATIAAGLETLHRIGPRRDVKAIADLAKRHAVAEIVVGLPLGLDGSAGMQAQKVLAFVETLKAAVRIPVVPWDERFTTVAAEQALIEGEVSRKGRKAVIDKVAAILILQNYLDYRKTTEAEARLAPV